MNYWENSPFLRVLGEKMVFIREDRDDEINQKMKNDDHSINWIDQKVMRMRKEKVSYRL